jgi:hypothetical protein
MAAGANANGDGTGVDHANAQRAALKVTAAENQGGGGSQPGGCCDRWRNDANQLTRVCESSKSFWHNVGQGTKLFAPSERVDIKQADI